ncbi:MAG TPA: DUF2474 domain-containing protein [Methylotenera sp.]|nr:DUF2474 domain-containing protein [Methylotenera sp.]
MVEMDEKPVETSWPKRIGWLVLIWAASVLALILAAYVMRLFMRFIGLG